MSQFIFVEDFIIAKSEIVSVQFHFKSSETSRMDRPENWKATSKVWGESTVVFVLKDGSTRITKKHGYSERLDELKEKVVSQMQEVVPIPSNKTAKTTITTTRRRVPVNGW